MTWDYLAGFVDGEGAIVKKHRGYVLLISQTNFEVLNDIKSFTKVGRVYNVTKRKVHWKDAWVYSSGSSENTYRILFQIVDRLIVKKQLALKVIKDLEIRLGEIEKRKAIKQNRIKQAKQLRRKGLTYRKIGRILKADFGYIRRIVLFG